MYDIGTMMRLTIYLLNFVVVDQRITNKKSSFKFCRFLNRIMKSQKRLELLSGSVTGTVVN